MLGLHSKKDCRKILCLPLAVFGIIYGVFQIAYGAVYLSYAILDWDESSQTASWIAAVLNGVLIVFGVLGLVAILTRWSSGMSFFMIVIKMTLVMFVMSLVTNWVVAICAWAGIKSDGVKEMTKERTAALIVVSVTSLVGILLCWIALSCFGSLQKVLQAGGSGFEKKNYKEIRDEKSARRGMNGGQQQNGGYSSSSMNDV